MRPKRSSLLAATMLALIAVSPGPASTQPLTEDPLPFPVFEKRDDIPAAFIDEYEERDGKWHPKASDDASELKTTLEKERQARKDAEKREKDAARERDELKTKQKAAETGITDDKLKEIRADVRKELETEYAPKLEAGDKAVAENRTLKLDNQVRVLAGKAGVRADRMDQWWKQFGDRFDLTDDGKPMVKDKPGTSLDTYIGDALKKELPDFYQGTQGSGGGAAGAQGGAPAGGKMSGDDILKNPGAALEGAFGTK